MDPNAPALPLAIAGAIGAFAAAHLGGWLIGWAMRRPGAGAIRANRTWQVLSRLVLLAPFGTVAIVFSVDVPPLYLSRALVIPTSYPIRRYALAVASGRFARFYAIAVLGQTFAPPAWVALALLPLLCVWSARTLLHQRTFRSSLRSQQQLR